MPINTFPIGRWLLALLPFLYGYAEAQEANRVAKGPLLPFEQWCERHKAAIAEIRNNDTDFAAARSDYVDRLEEAAEKYKTAGDLDAHEKATVEKARFRQENVVAGQSSADLPSLVSDARERYRQQAFEAERARQRAYIKQWRLYRIRLLDMERLARAADDDGEADDILRLIREAEAQINAAEAKLCRIPGEPERQSGRLPGGLERGLVLHYGFDREFGSQVVDVSPHGNHGVMHGATRSRQGRAVGACFFDGLDDHIITPSSPSLRLDRELTLSVRVLWRPDSQRLGISLAALLTKGTASSADYWVYLTPGHTVGAGVRSAEVDGERLAMPADPALEKVAVDTWVHIVFTYDGRVARTFVDGKQDKKILLPGGIGGSDAPLHIGRRGLGRWTYGFTGTVDDVLIWNRALTEVEVLGLCTALKMTDDSFAADAK